MRLIKIASAQNGAITPVSIFTEGSHAPAGRQFTLRCAALALGLLVSACSGGIPNPLESIPNPFAKKESSKGIGESGFVQGFLGGVAADEPQAAIIGREILSAGGSAADAVTAMYFALAVTKPTEAGLGGGGVCVIRDNNNKRNDTLDFQARLPIDSDGRPMGGVPVPGNPRGFAVLHAKLGALKWAQVIQPAENLARFGSVVSRAFATDLRDNAGRLATLPAVVHLLRKSGHNYLAGEGDRIDRARLAGVLARMRVRGAGDFYQGQLAQDFVKDANRLGGRLSMAHMRHFIPEVRPTIVLPYVEGTEVHVPSPPGPGGAMVADLMGLLVAAGIEREKNPGNRAHLIAEASTLSAVHRHDWLRVGGSVTKPAFFLVDVDRHEAMEEKIDTDRHQPWAGQGKPALSPMDGYSATGLVAIDKEGSAVACTVTMNKPFGSGRVLPSLGILLAQPVGRGSPPPASATPLLIVSGARRNQDDEFVFLSATATGGPGATDTLADLVVRVSAIGQSLEPVISGPRIHTAATEDALVVEPGLDENLAKELQERGHVLRTAPSKVRINAIYCETGVPNRNQFCAAFSDPRGLGLAAQGDR